MADNRVTKQRLKEHWRYSKFLYVLLAVVSVLGVDLLFSVTAYRSPDDKRLHLYMCNGYADTDALQTDLRGDLFAACPEQEEFLAMNVDLINGDSYTQMQFSTYVGAREGDVMLLPYSEVKVLAEDGADFAFMELTPYVESGVIPTEGIDLSRGMMKDSQGGTGLYAIPADALLGLRDYYCNPSGAMLVAMSYNGNEGPAATLIGQMVARFIRSADDYDTPVGEGTRLLQ